MGKIEFTKMEGLGNDYIYVDTCRFPIANPGAMAEDWSRYHTGIGSDGLVLTGSSKAGFSMWPQPTARSAAPPSTHRRAVTMPHIVIRGRAVRLQGRH